MVQEVIWNILRFVVVVALQVFVLNELRLGGFINPWLYLYFILMLPIHIPGWLLLMVAFLTGFTIDVFSNTIGMHTLATVFLAFCRPGVLNFIAPREGYEFGLKPTISHLGIGWFLAYAGSLVFLHHTLLFFVEAFKLSEFFYTLFRVILSGIATMILLVLAQYLTYRKKGDTL